MFHHLGSIIGGLIVVVLVGCGQTQDPAAAYREIVAHAERGDWGAVYDRYDQQTRAQRELLCEIVRKANPSKATEPRQQHITLMQDHGDATLGTMRGTLSAPQIDSDRATLTLTMADGTTRPVRMTREGGRWMLNEHFDFFQSIADRKGTNRQAERHVWHLKGLLQSAECDPHVSPLERRPVAGRRRFLGLVRPHGSASQPTLSARRRVAHHRGDGHGGPLGRR